MNKLWMACLGAWMLVCCATGTALAQTEAERVPFCGELSGQACAALEATTARMAALTAGVSENQVALYVKGGALGDQALTLHLTTTTAFVVEPATLARINALRAMPPEQLAADPAAAAETLTLPLAIDMRQTTAVAFSPSLLSLLAARFHMDIPPAVRFETRLVDGVLYIRLADYAVFGAQPAWMPEWVGIELASIVAAASASEVTSPDFNVQESQAALMTPGMGLAANVLYEVPPQQIDAYADFMRLTLQGTAELEGKPVNIYRLTWDIPRYLGGPLFAEQMGLPAAGYPNAMSLALGTVSAVLLHGLDAEVIQAVGVDDAYLYQVTTRVEWEMAIPGVQSQAARPTFGFTSTLSNRDLNAVQSIPVPAGAVVPPIGRLVQAFSPPAR